MGRINTEKNAGRERALGSKMRVPMREDSTRDASDVAQEIHDLKAASRHSHNIPAKYNGDPSLTFYPFSYHQGVLNLEDSSVPRTLGMKYGWNRQRTQVIPVCAYPNPNPNSNSDSNK